MTENPPVRDDGTAGPDGSGGFEILLAAAVRSAQPAGGAEERAVAAFREARDRGAHSARTRRRDDWRPRPRGLARWSLRATVGALVAGVALGGVAMAGIGAVDDDSGGGTEQRPTPRRSATSAPGRIAPEQIRPPDTAALPNGTPPPGRSAGHPDQAGDTLAKCHAYESVKGRGNALDSPAWQRFLAEAGGEASVAAYCADEAARQEAGSGNGGGDKTGGKTNGHETGPPGPKPGKAKNPKK